MHHRPSVHSLKRSQIRWIFENPLLSLYICSINLHPRFHCKIDRLANQESGACEAVLVLLALALWLYSFYRLYLVWQNTLNFQESSIQGPQGWDLLVNWILERIRKDTTCVTVSCRSPFPQHT